MHDGTTDENAVTWPAETPRYRIVIPADEDAAALDVLAAVLDASPRTLDSVAFEVDAGRRADADRIRSALADLAAHPDVTVGTDKTTGAVPMTDDTFAALADLFEETKRLVVRAADGTAIVQRRHERFTFALQNAAIEAVESSLSERLLERLELLDD